MNKLKNPFHSMALILTFCIPVDKWVCWQLFIV